MSKKTAKPARTQKTAKPASAGSPPEPITKALWLYSKGFPYANPEAGHLRSRAPVPFACGRCHQPLVTLQGVTLNQAGFVPVICLGTCLEAIAGKPGALAELGLDDATQVYNSFQIPLEVYQKGLTQAQAFQDPVPSPEPVPEPKPTKAKAKKSKPKTKKSKPKVA